MTQEKAPFQNPHALRRKAEELSWVREDQAQIPENMLELINELRIHQAELEIQNEELKRSHHELACLHREFSDLYEQAPCGYLTVNPKGIITRINRSGVTLLGKSREQILNTEFYTYLMPPFQELFWTARKRAAESGEAQNVELQMTTPEDFPSWVRADISPEYAETETPTGWRVMFTDITQTKQLEAQLRQSHKMEAMGTLAGGIAHEFNNVLAIILGNTELALYDVPDRNPAKESLQEIRIASLRAREMIQQILSFARKSMMVRQPVAIAPVIRESLNLIRASIPTMIDIRSRIFCENEMVLGHETEVQQIIINLCNNAAHAMKEEGGTLDVHLFAVDLDETTAQQYDDLKPGPFIKLAIKDTGHGIAPEIMEKIFDPYFTTKEIGQGTGMGLSVVQGIVKKWNGDIKISSEPGKGTMVEVLFPQTERSSPDESTDASLPASGKGERILFVDDEESITRMGKQTLERLGYEMVCMTDSLSALEYFRADPFGCDLVITDMAMPKMAGDRFAAALLEIRKDIPILLLTGHSDRIDEKRAQEMGIRGFAMKPLDMVELSLMIRKVLVD